MNRIRGKLMIDIFYLKTVEKYMLYLFFFLVTAILE